MESLEDRRLLSAGPAHLLAAPADPTPAPAAPALTLSATPFRQHHKPGPRSAYLGQFAGHAVDVDPTTGVIKQDRSFVVTITAYTPPGGLGGTGSITATVSGRHGSVSFTGFTKGNVDGGFFYARHPTPNDPDVNHGPDLEIYATLAPNGKYLVGAVSGKINGVAFSEQFQMLPRA